VRGPTRLPQGALSNYKKAADEPDDHAIGRSRGGLTTKIHALTDQREVPVAVRLTAGQAGDNPQLVPLLDDYGGASRDRGVSGRDFRLLADKA
jgi:putative transposase